MNPRMWSRLVARSVLGSAVLAAMAPAFAEDLDTAGESSSYSAPAAPPAAPAPVAPVAAVAPVAPRVNVESFTDLSGKSIDERRPLNADGSVSVNNVAGNVNVVGWDRGEVYVSGQIGSGVERVELSGDASALAIVVRLPKRSHSYSGDTDLKLYVPTGAKLNLETVSADIGVDGVKGPLRVNTVSGDARISVRSPDVSITTVSGDVTLRAPSTQTRLNSVSGDLHVADASGELSAETVSGNLELNGGRFGVLKLKSISGDMRAAVTLTDKARVTGETLSGQIVMSVPNELSGMAMLTSFSGDATCDSARPVEGRDSRKKREYQWGSGDGVKVELSSFSGDIRVQKEALRDKNEALRMQREEAGAQREAARAQREEARAQRQQP